MRFWILRDSATGRMYLRRIPAPLDKPNKRQVSFGEAQA
jgi:hypothetical protein